MSLYCAGIGTLYVTDIGALSHAGLRSARLVIPVSRNALIVHIVTPIMTWTPGVTRVVAIDRHVRIVRIRGVVDVDTWATVPPTIPIGMSVIWVSIIAVVIHMEAI